MTYDFATRIKQIEAELMALKIAHGSGHVSSSNLVYRGSCSTATATADKVATLEDGTGFSLTDGVIVAITFANSNTYSSSTGGGGTIRTLNVDSTGAKEILDYSDVNGSTAVGAAIWMAGETVEFCYDSSKDGWMRMGGAPSYVRGSGTADFTIGNTLIQSGTETAASSATTDVGVTFGTEFASAPRVILTTDFNESGGSLWWAFTKSITSTGFTFRSGYTNITGTGGGGNSSAKVSWIAIGMVKGA